MNMSEYTESPTWPLMFARFAAALTLMCGTAVICSWTFYYWVPKDLLVYLIAVKPNTGTCFILCGISLWINCENYSQYARYIGQICSGSVFLIGCLTLLEYFFNVDFGIDKGFFNTTTNVLPQSSLLPVDRMSPFVAANFVLTGFVLFFLDNRVISFRVNQLFVSIMLFFMIFEFLNRIYKFGYTPGLGSGADIESQMALPVLGVLIFLELGIFFCRPSHGVASIFTSQESGGVLARRLIPPAIILPIILGYLGLAGNWANFSEAELRISVLVMGTIIFFATFILLHAYFVDQVDVERKRAERALKLSQSQLQAVLDHTNAVIYAHDIEGKYLLANHQFERLVHKSLEEIKGKHFEEVVPPDLASKLVEHNMTVLETRAPIVVEERISTKAGTNFYILNIFPFLNESGTPYAIGGIAAEISAMKHIEETLRENEERLSLALQSAQAGSWTWDISRNIMTLDDYLLHLFGLSSGSFPGTFEAFLNLICPEDRKQISESIKMSVESGIEHDAEFRIIQNDGSLHYLGIRGKAYWDTHGRPVRMSGVCWNITRYKNAEKELRHSKEMAEGLAEQAAEASRAKSAFLAAMSHEIRTPLNGVIGMTGLLNSTPLNPEQSDYIETIRISGEALLSVINDILDFSKIESGRMELENVDFDLHALVDDVVEIIAGLTHKKGIAIGAFIEPNVAQWFNGDPSRVRQVLNNLLSNAAKFTDKGEISLRVKLLMKENKNVTLLFEVIDTGIGITPEVRNRLFQPFTQGDVSTSRKYGGTGLGLAISKRLVEIMGGSLDAESFPGRGTRFWFTIQLTECVEPVIKSEYKLLPELRGARILCVDDNAINREIIKRQIESWHMNCDVAVNAAEALSMLKKAVHEKEPYSLAVVDYMMPGMTGIEMIQILRELDEISATSVILVSSLGTTFSPDELEALRVSAVLTKPLRQGKLYESIVSVLKNKGAPTDKSKIIQQDTVPVTTKNAKILLVEDNAINQQVAMRMLRKLGYQCDIAGNGYEALKGLENIDYDLILMDCQMPEMDGYTATKEIRKIEKAENKKHTPIVAMTAHALKGDREKCLRVGMDDYIAKPIEMKLLATTIEKWLKENAIIIETSEVLTTDHSQSEGAEVVSKETVLPMIDMDRLHEIFGDEDAVIKEFLQSFVESTVEVNRDLNNAISRYDKTAAKELFHRLKGSAGNSGLMQLHALSLRAESLVLEDKWDEVGKVFHEIEVIFEKLQENIARM